MLLSNLLDLGFKEEEAKVYLSLLELGSSYVSLIAKKAGVQRVACYHTLEKLIHRGLITSYTHNKIKYFTVEHPQILVNQLENKFKHAKKLLPELLSITNALAYKPKIHYFEGLEGVKNIFEDTLTSQGELLGYTNLEAIPKVIPEAFIKEYVKRKMENNIRSRMLSPISDKSLAYTKDFYPKNFNSKLIEILFINPEQFQFEYEINIYDDKVSLVSLNPNELIGLIIESPVYAKTQKAIFNLAWLGATSFIAK